MGGEHTPGTSAGPETGCEGAQGRAGRRGARHSLWTLERVPSDTGGAFCTLHRAVAPCMCPRRSPSGMHTQLGQALVQLVGCYLLREQHPAAAPSKGGLGISGVVFVRASQGTSAIPLPHTAHFPPSHVTSSLCLKPSRGFHLEYEPKALQWPTAP